MIIYLSFNIILGIIMLYIAIRVHMLDGASYYTDCFYEATIFQLLFGWMIIGLIIASLCMSELGDFLNTRRFSLLDVLIPSFMKNKNVRT